MNVWNMLKSHRSSSGGWVLFTLPHPRTVPKRRCELQVCLFRAAPRPGTPGNHSSSLWLWLSQSFVAVSEQGLYIQPGQRNSSQKPRWALPDPCWSGRHNGAAMLAAFPREVHLENSWEKLSSEPPFLRSSTLSLWSPRTWAGSAPPGSDILIKL